jgi:hypothetical protein
MAGALVNGLAARGEVTTEMNRQERVYFAVYLALAVLDALFLMATGVAWWVGG